MVLGRHDYETAVKGKNDFVCIVQRSWTTGTDDPEFWNPKLRAPICFNPPAVRSYLPQVIRKTGSILAGRSKEQMAEEIKAALDKEGIAVAGARRNVLHDVEARALERPRWALAPASYVFSPRSLTRSPGAQTYQVRRLSRLPTPWAG